MRVTEVKLLNDGVNISWQTSDKDGGTTKHSRKNGKEAAPSFHRAVEALKEDVQSLMETTKSWMETVVVKGLKANYDEDGTIEATLSFTKKFKSGRAKGYSTPAVRQRTDSGQAGKSFMSDDLEAKIQTVIDEAEKYVEGLREQTEH